MKTGFLISLALASATLVACGGGGGSTATNDTTTDPSETSANPPGTSGETGLTGTTAPTTGPDDTTSPPATSTTTDPGTSTTIGETTAPATSTTTGETTDVGTDSSGSETTGDPPAGGKCVEDKDCTLVNDCCRCEAIAVGDPIPECPMMECFAPVCDTLGVKAAECRLGTCVTEKLNCDASTIACDEAAPDCPQGTLPGVDDNNVCWTGGCVPIEHCNFVSSCTDCPQDTMCVVDETLPGPKFRCEPIPAACMGGEPTCDCAGEACDTPPYDICYEQPDALYCSCPFC